jgi:hypothetical protein
LEQAADNREATPWKGARSTSTGAHGMELDINNDEDKRNERSGAV